MNRRCAAGWTGAFPFLFGGTFIEAGLWKLARLMLLATFLCPGQGLSLRHPPLPLHFGRLRQFPFLLGRAFIEAENVHDLNDHGEEFPFLLGRAFIEAVACAKPVAAGGSTFPFLLGRAFIEASLAAPLHRSALPISLPFGRDFH